MGITADALRRRLADVRADIAAAAGRAGRPPDAVRIVVVTKSAPPGVFAVARAAGVTDVGENRAPAALERMRGHETDFRWHFVGHVQSNKAARLVPRFDVFHGVDSTALLHRIDRLAGEADRRPEVFLQVNVSGEAAKSGFAPDALASVLDEVPHLGHARVVGLMTMAPIVARPEDARGVFAALAALRDRLAARPGAPPLPGLSMGMSDDFEVAVEEGATVVRLGRRLLSDPADAR